jgi:hypothetical protein
MTALIDRVKQQLFFPAEAKRAIRRDRAAVPSRPDPGIDAVVEAGLAWLGVAQDRSASQDGGVARHYSVVNGWGQSYPETTGYIVPTMMHFARVLDRPELELRARRMLDWLVAIQMPGGGFQGGMVNATPKVPVTFNTGQILMGLAAGTRAWGEAYAPAMRQAADWLATTLDADGCWRRHATPFAKRGEKAYETHVTWGLLEALRVEPNAAWAEAARRQIDWAIGKQQPNGWVADCCLTLPATPLTHTLGYYLRGLLEASEHFQDERYLAATRRTADGLLTALRPDGWLPGRLASDWSAASDWVCLTGAVQIAHTWLRLYELTGERRYLEAGRLANGFVRRTVLIEGPEQSVGAVQGSYPISGSYGQWEYLNWACKFMLDSVWLERQIAAGGRSRC